MTPYTVEPVDARIFDPQKAMKVYDRNFDWRRVKEGPKLDDPHEQREAHYLDKSRNGQKGRRDPDGDDD